MHEIGENVPPRERSTRHGVKDIWNYIRSLEKIGRGCTGMKAIPRSSPRIMPIMNLRKTMISIFHHTVGLNLQETALRGGCRALITAPLSPISMRLGTWRRRSNSEQVKDQGFQGGSRNGDTWEKVDRIRDKFEYDKERRMSEKAFAPMHRGTSFNYSESDSRIQPFDAHKYFPESESDPNRNYR
ncbi:hypothetical protein IFM89_013210 [Coptis chinensis]|uniref:Uncharacterized protein n=1 Tax=Coptis chinensis TaxID=261450 RepID=A0A835M609_9MAGN|nr:hypothetical protein IFM89_013210 [Coptis chinensis]